MHTLSFTHFKGKVIEGNEQTHFPLEIITDGEFLLELWYPKLLITLLSLIFRTSFFKKIKRTNIYFSAD